ncbi:non-homologous end joining protein Ku [Homoserinibacter sp. YIM 151385]|uniref:non-homologous end joining protein Ku n=1 Tax=Homoserinibacter sp. YIM 151385 TaxID=2985506 RepID=UPI0022EFE5F0|nr:Ku protein [Homoserinibacter sp. YIM 151385]WBU38386.1 Ku protein [Homoserinibacter sp. YIM 151385]
MRAIWKGSLSFGLVNVPVKLYSATEDHDLPLHQVHDADGGRIRYQRRCEVCGKAVDYEHIDRAYDDGEETVVLTRDDLDALPVERSHEIDVVEFVPSEQIDQIRLDRSYFLAPDSSSIKAYALLRRTLEDAERTAIVHLALRQRTRLAALRVHGDVLLLQTLLWDDEVREAAFPALDEHPRISQKEREMSRQLIESFASDFSPERFTDEYQEQLRKLVDAKLEQGESIDTDATFGAADDEGGEVLDLMEALKRSVESRRSSAKQKPAQTRKPAASQTSPATTATAKKPAAKKAPAKAKSARKRAS